MPPLGRDQASIPQRSFNFIFRPACWAGEPRIFLFLVGMALPIALLISKGWTNEATLCLAIGFLLSSVGFELATNALRQAVSITFLLAGITFAPRLARFLALVVALLIHDSTWVFLPWFILVSRRDSPPKTRPLAYPLLFVFPFAAFIIYLLITRLGGIADEPTALAGIYASIYAEHLSVPFLIFTLLPPIWVFCIRVFDKGSTITAPEKITFWYSVFVLTVTAVFFPLITYRFAMTAAVLQVFMAMRAGNVSIGSGMVASAGLTLHFVVYATISPNVRAVLHG